MFKNPFLRPISIPEGLDRSSIAHLDRKQQQRTVAAYRRFMQVIKSYEPKYYSGKAAPHYIWTCNAGVNWFLFSKDTMWDDMPKERRDYIDQLFTRIKYGDTPQWHSTNYDHIINQITKGDAKQALHLAMEGKNKIENLKPELLDIELSAALFLADFELEDIYHVNQNHLDRKRELIANDLQTKMFFFHFVEPLFLKLTSVSEAASNPE